MAPRRAHSAPSIPSSELSTVAFDRIHRSPLNPRTDFPAKGIEDLAATIEREGLLEALTVRPAPSLPGHFEIAAGERRYRALELLEKRGRIPSDWRVPVQIRDLDDRELLTLALVENLLREDLHPLDEAFAYQRLVDQGVKTAEIARRVKRSQRHIQLRIQLTGLAPEIQNAFRAGEILLAQARVLATAPPERHLPAFEAFRHYPSLFEDPKNLMALLAKGTFPRERAAFAPSKYKGPTIQDPESGQVFYLDLAQVLRLQARAAEELREKLLSEHQLEEVEILQGEPSQVWTRYRESQGKATHGAIVIAPTGEITAYKRLVPVSGAAPERRAPKSVRGQAAEPRREAGSASLLAAAQRIRNSALQDALAGARGTALRLAVVGLLQKPGSSETGVAFGPVKPAPPAEPEPTFVRKLAEQVEKLLGPDALPALEDTKSPLERISQSEEALRLFEVLEDLSDKQVDRLLTSLVAARVGSPGFPGDDALLVAKLAQALAVSPAASSWLRPEYLQHYSRSGLIRLAIESGAVAAKDAKELHDLTREQLIARILESDTSDPDFLPPELSFSVL